MTLTVVLPALGSIATGAASGRAAGEASRLGVGYTFRQAKSAHEALVVKVKSYLEAQHDLLQSEPV